MSDEAKERRAAKRGAGKVERERLAREEAERFMRSSEAQPALFDLVAAEGPLPDDDKPSGPGRPVGARATAPAEFRRYILATKGDFVGRFAGLANVDTFALARLLGCLPVEALRLQLDMGKMAAPYVYQAQPRPEIEQAADYFAGLLFLAGGQAAAGAAGGEGKGMLDAVAALAGRPPDMQEIQALSGVEFAKSEPAQSEPATVDEEKAP